MRAVDIIARKRDGQSLTTEEIEWFIAEFTRGAIPDYQAAAWLMAVVLKGMDDRETVDLTLAMARSGQMLDLAGVRHPVVDKHSTGGVGDKISLVVAPMVAATGLAVGKMSGRGLGFSGGTLDKLESFAGFNVAMTTEQFLRQLREIGLVIAGQSADFAPADGKLYALRDVTATVESLPLIASSIMSKKIAAGADAIVLDVKAGRGAFMKTDAAAATLAETMVRIGQGVGRRVAAIVSAMDQPLGQAIGNALEVKEALATLRGDGPPDLQRLAMTIGAYMLILGERATSVAEAEELLGEAIASGAALARLRAMVVAQGGDGGQIDDPDTLPAAPVVVAVPSPQSGYVAGVDPLTLALTAVELGAGRARKGDPIDPAVGLVVGPKIGETIAVGEPLAYVHARTDAEARRVAERVASAFAVSQTPVQPPRLIHQVIT
ncbi:MAG: thymidine phosphorylase [Anaerolineae bacterium]